MYNDVEKVEEQFKILQRSLVLKLNEISYSGTRKF